MKKYCLWILMLSAFEKFLSIVFQIRVLDHFYYHHPFIAYGMMFILLFSILIVLYDALQ